MTITPETLDPIMCESCTENTEAAAMVKVDNLWNSSGYFCSFHTQEIASEFRHVSLHPVTYPKPEYTALETEASHMSGEWTLAELELAAKYGAPYPVCGDLTTRKRIGKSWVGHDPSGEQY